MSIGSSIYSLLSGNAALTARVATRIYPGVSPPTAPFPRIVYSVISNNRQDTLTGHSARRVRVQISCYDTTYVLADSLAALVEAAFDTLPGQALRPFALGRNSVEEDTVSQGAIGVFHESLDFSIWIQE